MELERDGRQGERGSRRSGHGICHGDREANGGAPQKIYGRIEREPQEGPDEKSERDPAGNCGGIYLQPARSRSLLSPGPPGIQGSGDFTLSIEREHAPQSAAYEWDQC